MEKYHSDHWARYLPSERSEKFAGRSHHTCVVRGNLFWVFGGLLNASEATDDLFVLDFHNFGTEKITSIDHHYAIELKKTYGTRYRVVLEGQAVVYCWTKQFTTGAKPGPRAGHTASLTADNKYLVVIGGRGGESEEIHLLNFQTLTWTQQKVVCTLCDAFSFTIGLLFKVANLPLLCNHSSTVLPGTNRLLMFGGFDEFGTAVSNIYMVDLTDYSCHQLNAQGFETRGLRVCV
jgi:hypothetical protein